MLDAHFFGYGSLVNPLTHAYTPVRRARLAGWRRAWVAVPDRQTAYLTAVPDAGTWIDGLIAPVPGMDWTALDSREEAYERLDATHSVTSDHTGHTAVYAVAPDRCGVPGPDNPILLSYLDVVIQGYLTQFGPTGAAHFFETTSGWQAPILNDRDAPRYPRAQSLTPDQRATVDAALADLGKPI